jgi:hypothetical protein
MLITLDEVSTSISAVSSSPSESHRQYLLILVFIVWPDHHDRFSSLSDFEILRNSILSCRHCSRWAKSCPSLNVALHTGPPYGQCRAYASQAQPDQV